MLPPCKAAVAGKPDVWAGECGGVIDALIWIAPALEESNRFCPPLMPSQQSQRVVVLYMERHPEQLHRDFKALALRALQEAWPCPK